ncbi:DNA-processing protein DprA [Noviherbaspirillum sp. UKPF54]|uniref:DNA-processing protein DprA n=1 Tax=Noviherbaspirillum sp. UKPF54 TaxID=2601898 RepID=UPI0011B1C362|nr:DNA-processing protein DprA [Noviherbaspirillum sp. UKPF54]QDZ29251.1 DNA-protecting protein DprA [Noviherbaspirillum sp. UKPF54]
MTHPAWTDDLAHWLRLERTPGVGSGTARKLLAAFGLPQNIFSASHAALREVVSERVAEALLAPVSDGIRTLTDRTLEWAEQPGNRVLTLADTDYPQALLDITDPPCILYVKGRTDLLSSPALAVVGSRNATAQGISNAEKFSETLSQAGLTIISGMALGIDAAAHHGGLRGAGSTVAVIGTGANIIYPTRNRALAHMIAEGGCIVSEYALGTPVMSANFPRRNRIISGLAQGVLVVEAAAQSGSLITARLAAEQGRDVFAIPGSIHSPLSKGCHLLIKQGAKLVESAQDVLDELKHPGSLQPAPASAALPAVGIASSVLKALGHDPADLDTLAARCELDIAALHAELLTLELDGHIEMLPGGLVRRLATS